MLACGGRDRSNVPGPSSLVRRRLDPPPPDATPGAFEHSQAARMRRPRNHVLGARQSSSPEVPAISCVQVILR